MENAGPAHPVGRRMAMIDGPDKITGRAKFTADLDAIGALTGKILRSSASHADIVSIDTSAAMAMPGVIAVVTGADCDKTYGVKRSCFMNALDMHQEIVEYCKMTFEDASS